MILLDVSWTNLVNILTIKCDCVYIMKWPTNISLVDCDNCGCKELWHKDAKDFQGFEDFNVIEKNKHI